MLTRQEKERKVIDLYNNQNKTYREIAKEVRICPRDIGIILKKASGEMEEKQEKEKLSLSPSAHAYRLYSEGMTLLEVAIALDLNESEATKYYEEYLDLKQMYELRTIYEEIGGDILQFLKLFRLSKKERINPQHIVSLLRIAKNDLPELERRYHRLKRDIVLLELEKQKLEQMGGQVRILAKMSEDYKQQIEELRRKKMALESLIKKFENNKVNMKIRRIAEEEVNNTLSKSKNLLTLAVSSVIESIMNDHTGYNFLINSNQYKDDKWSASHPIFIDKYRSLILDNSQALFEFMEKELTDNIIERAILIGASSRQNVQ
jgi:hypothetical protein